MTANEFMTLPPAEWEVVIDAMPGPDRFELAEELQGIACRAMLAHGYVDARYGSGCGDQGHVYAVKVANRQLKATRKAIGFTYPERSAVAF